MSMVVAGIIGCVFVVPAPSRYKLVGFITGTTALTYIMGGVGLPVLRKTSTAKVPGIAASLAYLAAWVYIQYR